MRINGFGESYCHTANEARALIEAHGAAVYASGFYPREDNLPATAEVVDNESGEIVCLIEAATLDDVRAIILDLGLEVA
jgi:hypothetical protein